jgi:predicted DNA-binding mobile mystery protein A
MKNRRQGLNVLEELAMSKLQAPEKSGATWQPGYGDWIRILRTSLRMTQADLARRAGIAQPNLAEIENGKRDPQLSTIKKIFDALSCDMDLRPRPRQPLDEILRGKARSVALMRLKQSMGTMAMEHQAPNDEVFRALLEKRTDEILSDKRERLWREDDGQRNRTRRRNSRR